MKALVVGLVFASLIGTAMAAKSSRKDLLFIGKVTAIGTAKTGDPRRNWIVSTSVEKVLSGTFSGETFDFAIHSPSRAGLEVGKSYKIPARWTGTGYLVDDFEVWKRNH